MTVHVAFSSAVLTNIIFPLGALSFSFALSFVWSSTSYHIVTTRLLSVINIRRPGQTHGTIDALLCETWAHEQARLSPWTGSLTYCWTMQRASGFIWLELKERERERENPHVEPFNGVFFQQDPPPPVFTFTTRPSQLHVYQLGSKHWVTCWLFCHTCLHSEAVTTSG